MISRRHFNLGAAAFLASASPFACSTKKEEVDVVIVGAGISGLYSAILLKELGLRVLVLEANSRVGGRVQTVNTEDGLIDVGASQIGNSYARVISLCRKYGLNLIPEDRDLLDFQMHFQGNWVDPKTWSNNPLNKCVGAEREMPLISFGRSVVSKYNPLKTFDDWLKPKFSEWDISLRQLMIAKGYSDQAVELARWSVPGISIDDTSLLRIFQEAKRVEYEKSFSQTVHSSPDAKHPFGEVNVRDKKTNFSLIYNVEGGCQQLPNAMAAEIENNIRLNKKVVGIEMDNKSAVVSCEDGSSYNTSFVISALPFSMLKSVEVIGKDNPIARKAISSMPYANTARLYLKVKKPFWEMDNLSPSFSTDGPIGMFWAIDNHGLDRSQRAMVVLVGESGREISKRKNPEEFIIKEIERLRPASKGLLTKLTYKDWSADPLQKGCGFSLAPGQVTAFANDMIKPWQVLYFAGEHTRRLDLGLESALESSERVVSEILVTAKG